MFKNKAKQKKFNKSMNVVKIIKILKIIKSKNQVTWQILNYQNQQINKQFNKQLKN